MQNAIQQDLKNVLVVGVDETTYLDTVENFNADYDAAIPALPDGITLRLYERGVRHPLIANNNVMDGGPLPWPEGDAIIDGIDDLLTARDAREVAAKVATKDISEPELDMGGDIRTIIGD
jgi:hypothetical protein